MVVGVTNAEPIENKRLGESVFVPFVSRDYGTRTKPASILKYAKSILVVCVPWEYSETNDPHTWSADNPSKRLARSALAGGVVCTPSHFVTPSKENICSLSSLGTNRDYHREIKSILQLIVDELRAAFPAAKAKILIDSPTLCERSLAVRAGLGFFGKNGLLYTKEYGSHVNIGLLLTDIQTGELEEYTKGSLLVACYANKAAPIDVPRAGNFFQNPIQASRSQESKVQSVTAVCDRTQYSSCIPECRLCIESCPNNALEVGKPLNANRCISYLTQKDSLDINEEKMLHGQLFGCDICQNVCPLNKTQKSLYVDPRKILLLSDEEIAEKFTDTALSWKARLLRRNAALAL